MSNFLHPPPPPQMGFAAPLHPFSPYLYPPFSYGYDHLLPPLISSVNFPDINNNIGPSTFGLMHPGYVYYQLDMTLIVPITHHPPLANNRQDEGPIVPMAHRQDESMLVSMIDPEVYIHPWLQYHDNREHENPLVPMTALDDGRLLLPLAIADIQGYHQQHNLIGHTNNGASPPIAHDDHQQRNLMTGQTNNGGHLSEETIVKHLRRRRVRPDAADYDGDKICVVCQDGLFEEENDEIATLHCGHDYHPECIKNWLFQNNVCPICKSTGIHAVD